MSLRFDNIVWYSLWYLFLGSLPCSAGDSSDKLYLNAKKPCDTYGNDMDVDLSGSYDDVFHFNVGVNLHRNFVMEDYIKVELGYGPFSPFPLFEDYVCNKKMLDCRKTCGYFDYDIPLRGFKLEADSEFYISVKLNGIVSYCNHFSLEESREESREKTGKIHCPEDTFSVPIPPRINKQDYARNINFNSRKQRANVDNRGRFEPPKVRVDRDEEAVDNKFVQNEPIPSQSEESDHEDSLHSTDFLPLSKVSDEEDQPEVETQKQPEEEEEEEEEPQPVERQPQEKEDEELLVAQLEEGNDESPQFESKQQDEVEEENLLMVQLEEEQKPPEETPEEEPMKEEETPKQSEIKEEEEEEAVPKQPEVIAEEEPMKEEEEAVPKQPEVIAEEEQKSFLDEIIGFFKSDNNVKDEGAIEESSKTNNEENVNNEEVVEVKDIQESHNNEQSVNIDDEEVVDEKDTDESSEPNNVGAVKASSPSSKKKRRKSRKKSPKKGF